MALARLCISEIAPSQVFHMSNYMLTDGDDSAKKQSSFVVSLQHLLQHATPTCLYSFAITRSVVLFLR